MASPATETKQLKVECDETALNLFYRCCMPALVTGIQMLDSVGIIAYQQTQVLGIDGGLSAGTVVEVCGGEGVGKSELLLHVAVQQALPHTIGGREAYVVYLDLDCRFNLLRAENVVMSAIRESEAFQDGKVPAQLSIELLPHPEHTQLSREEEDAERIMLDCMRRIKLERPAGAADLLCLLELLRAESERGRASPFLLIIDSLASFYFILSEHDAQLNAGIVRSVCNLVNEYSVTVLAAKPSFLNIRRPNEQHREYMPNGWAKLVTRRIILERQESATAVQGTVLSAIMSHHTHGINPAGLPSVGRRYHLIITDEGLSNFPSVTM